jgi:hypothetical protein
MITYHGRLGECVNHDAATGLWPVQLGAAFYTKENGPQGRGYSGGYSGYGII